MAIRVVPQPTTLTGPEQDDLRRAVTTQLPAWLPDLSGVDFLLLEQPFFRAHRICEAQRRGGFPARRFHFVLPAGAGGAPSPSAGSAIPGALVLTGHLGNLQAVCAAEPPLLPDVDTARAFANIGDFWTTESALGELLLNSFAEIPWEKNLPPSEQAIVDSLRDSVAAHLQPPQVEPTPDGVRVSKWILSNRALIRRELVVSARGQLSRRDEVLDEALPVPPGNLWGMLNGRLVPTG